MYDNIILETLFLDRNDSLNDIDEPKGITFIINIISEITTSVNLGPIKSENFSTSNLKSFARNNLKISAQIPSPTKVI